MGLFNIFSKEDKGAKLLHPDNCMAHYLLTANNEFVMGKANPVLSVATESHILLHQTVNETGIQTDITLQSITGKTEAPVLQTQLKQMLALAEISKQLVFERHANGKMQRITNMEAVHEQWQHWKQTKMAELFPLEIEQNKFADNFEKGLLRMDESIQNNLNYFILLPDIYHIKKFITPSNAGAELLLSSRLIADMPVRCRFVPIDITEEGDRAFVKLQGELLNAHEMQKKYLKEYYKKQTDFNIAEYAFTIDLNYEINSLNGQIIAGNLFLKEKMHDHLQYILNIRVDAIEGNAPVAEQQPGQTAKRRFLADEIMDNNG
jgi:hypothetical protein